MSNPIVIEAQYGRLQTALKDELFCLDDGVISAVSPFIKKKIKRVEIMKEYVYKLDGEQIATLREGQKKKFIYSDSFSFIISEEHTVEFTMGISNDATDTDKRMGFRVDIVDTHIDVDGRFSVFVDEIKYVA